MRRPKNTAYAAIHPRARPDPAAPQDRGIVRAQHAARYPAQRRSVGVRLRGVWAITDRLNAQTHPEQSLILRQFREVPAAAADLLTQTQSGCRSCRTCCSVRRPAGAHRGPALHRRCRQPFCHPLQRAARQDPTDPQAQRCLVVRPVLGALEAHSPPSARQDPEALFPLAVQPAPSHPVVQPDPAALAVPAGRNSPRVRR